MTPLIFLAVSAILNIALDLFFVIVLKLGVEGAAIATVISPISFRYWHQYLLTYKKYAGTSNYKITIFSFKEGS